MSCSEEYKSPKRISPLVYSPTFEIFFQGNGNVPFDPAVSRIFVRFKDGGGVACGSNTVAVRTQ